MTPLDHPLLIIDCQTTGMHPASADLIQLGWCVYHQDSEQLTIESRWIALPDGNKLSKKIGKLLAIDETILNTASSIEHVLSEFEAVLVSVKPPILVAHFISFELRFLKEAFMRYRKKPLPDSLILCTQKISKSYLPHLPSYTLKALAGYFKYPSFKPNNVTAHIEMTLFLWTQLKAVCVSKNIIHMEQLNQPVIINKPSKTRLSYRIDRLRRLALPEVPGIYRMITHDQQILYVGKATSLKSRVNSYFRGIKNRDKRILEMLSQTWEIETEP